jgi:hypothetical protein
MPEILGKSVVFAQKGRDSAETRSAGGGQYTYARWTVKGGSHNRRGFTAVRPDPTWEKPEKPGGTGLSF